MMKFDLSSFPKIRNEVQVEFRAVQAELLPQSGEKITVAVVAKDNHQWSAIAVPDLERLSCVYGSSALVFKDAADDFVKYINNLGAGTKEQDFLDLDLQLQNFSLSSSQRKTTGSTIEDALNAAIGQVSFLAAFHFLPSADAVLVEDIVAVSVPPKKQNTGSLNRKELVKLVLHSLDEKSSNLAGFMKSRRVKAPIDAPDYVSQRSAAEFTVLRHKRLSFDLPDVQASLWRLDAYKSSDREAVAFVYTDSPSDEGELGEVLGRATEQARQHNLLLVPRTDPDQLVSRLLQMEAA